MSEPSDDPLKRELLEQVEEPLLPIEKKLIVGSLALGFALLGILIWLSATYFPTEQITNIK